MMIEMTMEVMAKDKEKKEVNFTFLFYLFVYPFFISYLLIFLEF